MSAVGDPLLLGVAQLVRSVEDQRVDLGVACRWSRHTQAGSAYIVSSGRLPRPNGVCVHLSTVWSGRRCLRRWLDGITLAALRASSRCGLPYPVLGERLRGAR